MWIWAVFPCANWGCFNQHQCCLCVWTGQAGENGLCSSLMTKSIKSAFNFFFKHLKTNIKDFRNLNVSCVADLKGVFEIYIPKKQRRAWRNATSPSVQHTAHSLMTPYEDPPTSYFLLLFLLFLASIPSQVFRWLLFLGLATCTSISSASLSICLLEKCPFCPFLLRDSSTWPWHWGSTFGEVLLPLPADSIFSSTICLPPSLITLSPWALLSLVTISNTASSLGWRLSSDSILSTQIALCNWEQWKDTSNNHSRFIMTYQHQ